MAVGFVIILAIGAAALASSRIKNVFTGVPAKQKVSIDTTSWIPYTDPTTKLSFKRPSDWEVSGKTSGNEQLISLTPTDKNATGRISVYISKNGYLGFEGLPQNNVTLAGYEGVKVSDALLGLKKQSYYYTFDAGLDPKAVPIFQELIKTVRFE
jgi:hypothetical protein